MWYFHGGGFCHELHGFPGVFRKKTHQGRWMEAHGYKTHRCIEHIGTRRSRYKSCLFYMVYVSMCFIFNTQELRDQGANLVFSMCPMYLCVSFSTHRNIEHTGIIRKSYFSICPISLCVSAPKTAKALLYRRALHIKLAAYVFACEAVMRVFPHPGSGCCCG